jgi:cytochrome o ubiquinol oxidase operon protein cyoD
MSHHDHDTHLDIEFGNDHGSVKSYIHGFILSLVLTIIPFLAVAQHWFSTKASYIMIALFAVAQLFVQLVYFLHLSHKSAAKWNLNVFFFTLLVVLILVLGSIWIMVNLNYFMMH